MSNKVNKSAQRVLKAQLTTLKMVAASTLLASASLSAFAQECLSDGLETTPNDNFEAVTTSTLLDTTTDLQEHVPKGKLDGSMQGEAVKYT